MKRTVWFNAGLWVMAEAFEAIREHEALVPESERVIDRLIVTHTNPYFVGFEYADHAELEPSFNDQAEYAEWALAFVQKHDIDCIVATRNLEALSKNTEAFKAIGVELLTACDLASWDVIDDKIAFYRKLKADGAEIMLPRWNSWRSDLTSSLSESIGDIIRAESGDPVREACIKPARGIYGQGFFHFKDKPDPEQQLMNVETKIIEPSRFVPLAFMLGEQKGHSDWMVMEFMPGSEFSVDCLAWDGRLVTAIAREKRSPSNHGQIIVDDPQITDYCQQLAAIFGMQGVFNAQFKRDVCGALRVLEINPRFSGGMGMSLFGGVNLVWWWIKLASGANPSDVPASTAGCRVYSWRKAVILSDIRA